MDVFIMIYRSIVVHIALLDLILVQLRFVVFDSVRLEEILACCFCFDVLVLPCGIFLHDLTILSVEELTLLEAKLAQVA